MTQYSSALKQGNGGDYWIVREGPNGACRIVDVRPTDTKIVIVGNKAYKARDEAEKEMMVVCE